MKQSDLKALVLPLMEESGIIYRKQSHILAKEAEKGERIETITSDGIETVNTTKKGDYLVKNMTKAGEMYIISPEKFHEKYLYLREAEDGYSEYRSTGKITALELRSEILLKLDLTTPFYFEAPWGEDMIAKEGDFLAMPLDKSEVYRIAREEFFETYAIEDL